MKCIGGLADGKVQDVYDDVRDHDIVRVNADVTFKVENFEKQLEDFRLNKSSTVSFYAYKVHSLHMVIQGEKHSIRYLIPFDWHEWEAIKYLFRCHSGA